MSNKIKNNIIPTITIVVTRSYESLDLVKDCLTSLRMQKGFRALVLFLEQQKSAETRKYVKSLDSELIAFSYIQIPEKSLSYARNYGLKLARTKYVAFCDIDCILEKNWLSEIVATFQESRAAIVGTKIVPMWRGSKKWFHNSKFIQEFYSLIDISSIRCELPKVIGASFAVDKTKLGSENYFDERLGRKNGNFLGGEETDLCLRIRKQGGKVVYTPFTFARHQVSPQRMTLRWLVMKAYAGGISRSVRGGTSEPFNNRYSNVDRIALLLISPFYLFGLIRGRVS